MASLFDLDLGSMILVPKFDRDIVKIYVCTKIEFPTFNGSKVIAWTDTQTDTQTGRKSDWPTNRWTDSTEIVTYPDINNWKAIIRFCAQSPADADPPPPPPMQIRWRQTPSECRCSRPSKCRNPLWTEWHTRVKTLPCPKIRSRSVISKQYSPFF